MPTLWITEISTRTQDGRTDFAGLGLAAMPPIAEQVVTIPGISAAFSDRTTMVRVRADGECHLAFGSAPAATTAKLPLDPNTAEVFGVTPGHKIAVVAAA